MAGVKQTVAQQATDPRWAGKGPQGQNLVAWRNPKTGKTISGSDMGNSAYSEPIWGPASSGGGHEEGGGGGGGGSGAPGIEPIDDDEKLLAKEINAWMSGQRGLDAKWVEEAVARGTEELGHTRDDLLKQNLVDMNARGLTQSGLVTETNTDINKAYMDDIKNLRRDIELQRAMTNLQSRQFGVSSGLQLNSLRRGSALGAANLEASLSMADASLRESARQFDTSLAENSRLSELQLNQQNKLIKSQNRQAIGQTIGTLAGSGAISLAIA